MIEQVLAGEPWRFEMLVTRYERSVFLTSLAFLRNHQDAEDATQEVFVSAFRRLASFEGRSSFLTWLRRIAFNQCVDMRRKSQLRKADALENESVEPAHPSISPGQEAEANELVLCVRSAIDSLAEDQRAIVIMRDLEGLDYAEIAEVLEIPIGTVRSRLHRARSELKMILENRGLNLAIQVAPDSNEKDASS